MEDEKPIIGTRHADTQSLIEYLIAENVHLGTTVSYESMQKAAGRSRKGLQGLLQTVRKALAAEQHFFQCVRGDGWRRVGPTDFSKERSARRIRNAASASSTLRITSNVRRDELDLAERTRFDSEGTILALQRELGSAKVNKRLVTDERPVGGGMSLKECLQALKESMEE